MKRVAALLLSACLAGCTEPIPEVERPNPSASSYDLTVYSGGSIIMRRKIHGYYIYPQKPCVRFRDSHTGRFVEACGDFTIEPL